MKKGAFKQTIIQNGGVYRKEIAKSGKKIGKITDRKNTASLIFN